MTRGAINTKAASMVALWVPLPLLRALDQAVKVTDTDRSKFIRQAIRKRVAELLQNQAPETR